MSVRLALLRELHVADRARREALIGGGMPSDAGF